MPQMHLRKPAFTYSLCGRLTKKKRSNKRTKQKIREILIKTNWAKHNLLN